MGAAAAAAARTRLMPFVNFFVDAQKAATPTETILVRRDTDRQRQAETETDAETAGDRGFQRRDEREGGMRYTWRQQQHVIRVLGLCCLFIS